MNTRSNNNLKISFETLLRRDANNIKQLKTGFIGVGQVRGFQFALISKTNWAFLYEVDTGDTIYYEVFRKRINRRFACESHPTDKAFGIWAWTTPNMERALEILNNLSNNEQTLDALNNYTNKRIKN